MNIKNDIIDKIVRTQGSLTTSVIVLSKRRCLVMPITYAMLLKLANIPRLCKYLPADSANLTFLAAQTPQDIQPRNFIRMAR